MSNNRTSIICLLLLVAAAAFVSCRKETPATSEISDGTVRFMVLSDLHYMHPDILKNEGKAFDEYNAEECKLLRESGDILDAAIEKAKEQRPDFLIICGDMTKDGEVICHRKVAEVFKKLEDQTGTKVYVVPGNHDMNNPHSLYYDGDDSSDADSATEEQFALIYSNLGYEEAVARREGFLDYMAYPAEGIAFIGVDSNEKNTADKLMVQGGLKREQVAWIKEMAQKAHSDGRYVIMSMHHNLVDFYDHAQLLRGANIANARYEEYDNRNLIDDLCAAGIDVVFSGHSHMHSITCAESGPRTVYSIVTSSLVNLPLAYRIASVDKEGKMTLTSGDLRGSKTRDGKSLQEEGEKYWQDLTDYYMKEASDKAWDTAGTIIKLSLGFENKEALREYLNENVRDVFYTFLLRTSNGNEHLFTPKANYSAADEALEGILEFLKEKKVYTILDLLIKELLGFSIDDAHKQFRELFHSAYFNYLGDGSVMPDDAIEIQLTK